MRSPCDDGNSVPAKVPIPPEGLTIEQVEAQQRELLRQCNHSQQHAATTPHSQISAPMQRPPAEAVPMPVQSALPPDVEDKRRAVFKQTGGPDDARKRRELERE